MFSYLAVLFFEIFYYPFTFYLEMEKHHYCYKCSIACRSRKELRKHKRQLHSLELRCGNVVLKRNKSDEFKCHMQNHLCRSHSNSEPSSHRRGRSILLIVSSDSENQDISLQPPHHNLGDEYMGIGADHEDDDIVPGSDPNEDDMIIDSPNRWPRGDNNRQIHTSHTPAYQHSTLFSDQHSLSYVCDTSPHVPAQHCSTAPMVPESTAP